MADTVEHLALILSYLLHSMNLGLCSGAMCREAQTLDHDHFFASACSCAMGTADEKGVKDEGSFFKGE